MRVSRTTLISFLAVVLLSAVTAPAAKAAPITFTFATIGSGQLGAANFTDVLVTLTATGDTSAVTPVGLPDTGIFYLVPTEFEVNIAGVGTAVVTGDGIFGGSAYVFVNQAVQTVGFGTTGDLADISDPAFATYDLMSSIGPISGRAVAIPVDVPTTLGMFRVTNFANPESGTFSAQVSEVPEPSSLALLGSGISLLVRRSRRRAQGPTAIV